MNYNTNFLKGSNEVYLNHIKLQFLAIKHKLSRKRRELSGRVFGMCHTQPKTVGVETQKVRPLKPSENTHQRLTELAKEYGRATAQRVIMENQKWEVNRV
ncbi:hypothetical protein GINT2_000213 [Glugoides intestinalis]